MAPKKKAISREDDSPDLRRKFSSSSSQINALIAAKSFAHGRLVDFNFLEQENFNIGKHLTKQGWKNILSTKRPIYPELIREFYENIAFDNVVISSYVRKTRIDFDSKTLGAALNIPSEGILDIFPSERSYKIGFLLDMDDTEAGSIETLDANMLSVENRLFHSIIAKTLAPRAGSFNVVTDRDICIMYDVIIGNPVDLPDLIMTIMKESLCRSKAALPYGMFLTYVFEYFHIKLKGETVVSLRHTDVFNAHSLHRMDYAKRDGIWLKIRSRTGQSSSMPPPSQPQPTFSPQNFLNFDYQQPNPYLTAMNDPHHYSSETPDVNASGPSGPSYFNPHYSSAPPTVRICEEQLQQIIHELSLAQSSRSSGDSVSSVNDQALVPHISSVFETISQLKHTISHLVHDVNILNGRVFHHNESVLDKILLEINSLKDKVETFDDKAESVGFQLRTNAGQTRDAVNAVDHWTESLAKLTNLVETYVGMTAVPDISFSHPHLWAHPPAQPPTAKPGTSRKSNVASVQLSSDDEK